jgi:hypothetical protein
MKSIELTEKQKENLLEMCNKLFPEEGKWFKILCKNIYYSKNGKFPGKSIHWFEFCMTHLIVKLSEEFTKKGMSEADYTNNQYPNWFSEKLSYHLNPFRNEEFEENVIFIHPVDFLYEKFLKLK